MGSFLNIHLNYKQKFLFKSYLTKFDIVLEFDWEFPFGKLGVRSYKL